MKKLIGIIVALAVLGGAAFGGWVYAGKPNLFAGEQNDQALGPVVSSETEKLTEKYTAILSEDFVLSGGAEAKKEDVIALMPEAIKLSIGSSAFDAASGATIWTDVSLTGAGDHALGLTADEVKLWGLNTDGIKARIEGTNYTKTVKLAERIEASGLKTIGLEQMITDFSIAYVEGFSNTIEAVVPEEGIDDAALAEMREAMQGVFETYQINVDKFVLVGPQMRPWEIARIDPADAVENESRGALLAFQPVAAYYRTIGVDHMIWSNTSFEAVLNQEGIKQDMQGSYELAAYSGWYGGDLESSVIRNMGMEQTMDMREAFADLGSPSGPAFEQIEMDMIAASSSFEGMKLDKLFRFIAMGEWPSTDETDLMSLGRGDASGINVSFNDQPIFSVDHFEMDFSEWHWAIPTEAEIGMTNLQYNIDDLFTIIMEAAPEDDSAEIMQIKESVEVLRKYDALPFKSDFSVTWAWDPESGVFEFKHPYKHYEFGEANFEFSGTLPNFEQGVAAVEADAAYVPDPDLSPWELRLRETAWDTAFEDSFSLTSGLFVLDDKGGLDKLFAMASEFGKINPDEFGPMLANSTPEVLRQAAVSSVSIAAIEAGKEVPQAENWGMAFADWVRDGGTFTARLNPPEPLGADLEERYPDPSPDQIVEILGLTVTHEVP